MSADCRSPVVPGHQEAPFHLNCAHESSWVTLESAYPDLTLRSEPYPLQGIHVDNAIRTQWLMLHRSGWEAWEPRHQAGLFLSIEVKVNLGVRERYRLRLRWTLINGSGFVKRQFTVFLNLHMYRDAMVLDFSERTYRCTFTVIKTHTSVKSTLPTQPAHNFTLQVPYIYETRTWSSPLKAPAYRQAQCWQLGQAWFVEVMFNDRWFCMCF